MTNDNDHGAPRDCRREANIGYTCCACGCIPQTIHIPMHSIGTYCSMHCPCGGTTNTAVPSMPTLISSCKFNGAQIASLSLIDLKEAIYETSRGDQSLRAALLIERRRRWHGTHPINLTKRQQSAARRKGVVVA